MPRKKRNPEEIAESIQASMNACRAIVAAFASGKLKPEPMNGTRPQDIRYAPHFKLGMPLNTAGVQYVIGHITAALYVAGKNTLIHNGKGHYKANVYIVLAMHILAGIEEGWIDEEYLIENLKTGQFKISQLNSELKARREAHSVFLPPKTKARRTAGLGRASLVTA